MFSNIVNYKQPGVTDGLIRFYDPQIEMSTGSLVEQSGRAAAVGSGNGYSQFSGVPAYVQFTNNATNRFAVPAATDLDWNDGTVIAWVFLNGSSNINYCMANQRNGLGASTRYSLHLNPSTNVLGIYNGTAFNTVSRTIDPNIWYCIAWQLSRSQNASVFVNGDLVGTVASSIIGTATLRAFEFGNTETAYINEALDGRIGQVWNYSKRLLPQEITQVYQSTRDRYGNFI